MLFVIGDLLLRLCSLHDVTLCFVPGYEIKHVLGLQRGKSDPLDTCRIREYGERFYDRLHPCFYRSEEMSELQELYRTLSLWNRVNGCLLSTRAIIASLPFPRQLPVRVVLFFLSWTLR